MLVEGKHEKFSYTGVLLVNMIILSGESFFWIMIKLHTFRSLLSLQYNYPGSLKCSLVNVVQTS